MSNVIRLLPLLFLAGCTPTYLTAAAVHLSQPNHGPYPPPIGDHEASPETGYNGLELGARWEEGPYWSEAGLTYSITSRNVDGGPWLFSVKAGVRVKL